MPLCPAAQLDLRKLVYPHSSMGYEPDFAHSRHTSNRIQFQFRTPMSLIPIVKRPVECLWGLSSTPQRYDEHGKADTASHNQNARTRNPHQ